MRRWLPLFFAGFQCSPLPTCLLPVVPFSGQTNVALDVEISIDYFVQDDYPALENYPRLYNEFDREIEVEIRFDDGFTMIPIEPLEPDTEYEIRGSFGSPSRHYIDDGFLNNVPKPRVRSYFSTRSEPSILGIFPAEGGGMGLLLSEPVKKEDSDRFSFFLDDQELALTFAGFDLEHPSILYYQETLESPQGELYLSGPGFRARDSTAEPRPFEEWVEYIELPLFLGGEQCSR